MAATSQHRCVFVGNIPYDATEEQLVQICEEVGPVVSFRIVTDRETGKPKGYGFCEYKDEETALSARRNLNGYEINGRQLRVDCAANDKNADKNRDQGRGGPGMVSNSDSQKQTGGPAVSLTSGPHQPIGLPVAMTAASVMAGALGGVQAGSKSTQNGLHGQPGLGSDPLTLYLANMSRNQLTEILSELKVLATENKDQARQLLLTNPLLNKAFFQAQLMLGVVTSQMLQMPNNRQASGPPVPPSFQDAVHAQNTMLSQLPTQPRAQNNFQQLGPSPALPGVPTILPIRPQQMINTSVRPQIQPPLSQHPGQAGPGTPGHNSYLVPPYGNLPPSVPVRPPLSDLGFQPTSKLFGIPNNTNAESERPPQVTNDSVRVREVHTYQSLPFGSLEMAAMVQANSDPSSRPSKLVKMNDGRATSFSAADANVSAFRSSQVSGTFGNQIPKAQEGPSSINQSSQVPADVESALLQQVLNLTPEQLSSLPPDQQHQVIQLQQMLRSA